MTNIARLLQLKSGKISHYPNGGITGEDDGTCREVYINFFGGKLNLYLWLTGNLI